MAQKMVCDHCGEVIEDNATRASIDWSMQNVPGDGSIPATGGRLDYHAELAVEGQQTCFQVVQQAVLALSNSTGG